MTYTFTNNYNEERAQYIDELFSKDKSDKLPRQTRLEASDSLIESYVKHTGERPPSAQLGRLATLILRDELADKNEHKIRHNERPIMSNRQVCRRQDNEMPSVWYREIGVDGANYREPTRENLRKLR